MESYEYDHPWFLWSISDACHFLYHLPALGLVIMAAFWLLMLVLGGYLFVGMMER